MGTIFTQDLQSLLTPLIIIDARTQNWCAMNFVNTEQGFNNQRATQSQELA